MTDNSSAPAYPVMNSLTQELGLTKREYLAGLAMQGLLACPSANMGPEQLVQGAVAYTDALLAELSKPKP